jgi:hypothetical protein
MKNKEYIKQYEDHINKQTKEKAKADKPSLASYLRKRGLINSDNENDDDVYGSFREYIDRKEMNSNEQK